MYGIIIIIFLKIENEYGHFGYDDQPRDKLYLDHIRQLFDSNGFSGALYFTSDSPADTKDWGSLPGSKINYIYGRINSRTSFSFFPVLQTANFQNDVSGNLDMLQTLQPNRPPMVMEFWTGWFDHWLAEIHVTRPTSRTVFLH